VCIGALKREIMKDSVNLQNFRLNAPPVAGQFQAMINDKPFLAASVTGRSCWRSELRHKPSRRIWKILATGHVARHGTSIGLFIDQTLVPGTYDLVDNPKISVVYHRTPRQIARVYHSRHFQTGSLTLLECDPDTRRLRGTFEFGMSSIDFKVTAGAFNLHWIDESQAVSTQ
jgi:hypothetical protein